MRQVRPLRVLGRGGGIRTRDPLHPMQVRYQAALRPDTESSLHVHPVEPALSEQGTDLQQFFAHREDRG
jgi:hypothetical protein